MDVINYLYILYTYILSGVTLQAVFTYNATKGANEIQYLPAFKLQKFFLLNLHDITIWDVLMLVPAILRKSKNVSVIFTNHFVDPSVTCFAFLI